MRCPNFDLVFICQIQCLSIYQCKPFYTKLKYLAVKPQKSQYKNKNAPILDLKFSFLSGVFFVNVSQVGSYISAL